MYYKKSQSFSKFLSLVIHSAIAGLLFFITYTPKILPEEVISVGFGKLGEFTGSKNSGTLSPTDEKDESDKGENVLETRNDEASAENGGFSVIGNSGINIQFAGLIGSRDIYSYKIPSYPGGVSKEIDVKLKFTILPDGTVGKIIPLIKADTRLEVAAITSLRQWRFEPLESNFEQVEQTAVITFPFRLR